MSGDIVERLRVRRGAQGHPMGGHDGWCDLTNPEKSEAADEIVRLRAEVERLRAAGDALAEVSLGARPWITPLFAMEHGDRISAATAAWKEARREQ